jgi:hypothetical protein
MGGFFVFLRIIFGLCKGQVILKGLFGILEFSQKTNKQIVAVVKTNLFVRFLGEFEKNKNPFEIN